MNMRFFTIIYTANLALNAMSNPLPDDNELDRRATCTTTITYQPPAVTDSLSKTVYRHTATTITFINCNGCNLEIRTVKPEILGPNVEFDLPAVTADGTTTTTTETKCRRPRQTQFSDTNQSNNLVERNKHCTQTKCGNNQVCRIKNGGPQCVNRQNSQKVQQTDPCAHTTCGNNQVCRTLNGGPQCVNRQNSQQFQQTNHCEHATCGNNKVCRIVNGRPQCVDRQNNRVVTNQHNQQGGRTGPCAHKDCGNQGCRAVNGVAQCGY
jgi:hypothetical protein